MSKHDILIADPIYITKQTRGLSPKSDSLGVECPIPLYWRGQGYGRWNIAFEQNRGRLQNIQWQEVKE